MSSTARLVTDLNGRIASVSRGTGDLFVIEDRWLTGKPLAAFVVETERRTFRGLLLELGRGKGPIGTSLRLRRRDGLQLEVDVEAAVDAGMTRLDWLFASERLEPLLEAEVPILREGPVHRLLARLPIGVISLRQDLVVDYANPAARLLLGGIPHKAVLPEVLPQFSLRKFAARLFGPTPPPRRVVETAGGRLLDLEGVPGGHDTALLLIHDVTAEERRRRAEREFVTNAAHELRTPIAAIMSALDVLHEGADEVPADRELVLGHIQRETERLASLTAALMLLARIQMGHETPALRLVKVAPLLGEVAESLVPNDGVSVFVDCDPRVAVLTDSNLLQQAISNGIPPAGRSASRAATSAACQRSRSATPARV